MDAAAVAADPDTQRVEIQTLQGTIRTHTVAVVRHEQGAVHQVYVGLHAAEPELQRTDQRPRVDVVIVSECPVERHAPGRARHLVSAKEKQNGSAESDTHANPPGHG